MSTDGPRPGAWGTLSWAVSLILLAVVAAMIWALWYYRAFYGLRID